MSLPPGGTRCPQCDLPAPGALLAGTVRLEGLVRVRPAGFTMEGRVEATGEPVRVRLMMRGKGPLLERALGMVRAFGQGALAGFTPVRASDPDDAWPWVAEALPPGAPVGRGGRVFTPDEVRGLLKRAVDILGPLHARGGVHLEVRPENFWSRSEVQAGLSGPGWEWLMLPPPAARSTRDQPFVPPEGYGGAWSPAHDLYALGVCALQWLTGLPPESLRQGRSFSWRAAVREPGEVGVIIDRLVHADPDARIASVPALRELLEARDKAEPVVRDLERGERDDPERPAWLALLGLLPVAMRFWPLAQGAGWAWPGLKILVALGLLGGGTAVAWQRLVPEAPAPLPSPARGANPRVGLFDPPPWQALGRIVSERLATVPGVAGSPSPGNASPETGAGGGAPGASGSAAPGGRSGGTIPGGPGFPGGAAPTGGTLDAGSAGDAVSPAGRDAPGGDTANGGTGPQGADGREGAFGRAGASGRDGTESLAAGKPAGTEGDAPYDRIAEPGQDPDDASGLSPGTPWFVRVNKTYRTLTVYRDGRFLAQYPVTIGQGASTPEGRFVIRNKVQAPPFGRIAGGDPRNPFGTHWLGLDVAYPGGKGIGMHGTNRPEELGMGTSGGCIRLRNEDIAELYPWLPEGTPVEIQ
ncbi:MAG: L,D-transpeptidase family protein [Candidatus Sericytochromatia bacterium]|nr:L,D-transpeptidase family protein [Candidatus Sericytochromatia bacterium]